MGTLDTLVNAGQLLAALRVALTTDSTSQVLDFLEAAEDSALLASVSLLVAIELAEREPDEHVLIALERALIHCGLQDEANSVASMLKPTTTAVQRVIDAVITGSVPDAQLRRQAVAELEQPSLRPDEIEERRAAVRAIAARVLRGRG